MKLNFYKKLNYIAGFVLIVVLFDLIAFMANVEIMDFDLWLHLAVGKYITLNHSIPLTDILSCSINGAHWVNHEWLFQIIVYNLFNTFGANGLIWMQVAIVFLTMLILFRLGYSRDRQLVVVLSLFAVFRLYQPRFTIRPDIYSLLFFAIYIYILALYIDKKRSLFILFFVQVLWVNIHGFFFLGPTFVLIGIISEWIKRHVRLPYEWNEAGRLKDDEYRRMKQLFLLVVAAGFINPHFVEGALYPLKVFFSLSGENKIFFTHIQELAKPIAMNTLFSLKQNPYYKAIIIVSFISFIFNRRKIDISVLFMWIAFLIFSLQAVRNVIFFAFAAYLAFIINTINLSGEELSPLKFKSKKIQYLSFVLIKIFIIIWFVKFFQSVSGSGYYDFDKYEKKSIYGDISLRQYPYKAADFLVENNIKGNFYNNFNSGAYLLGRCFPNIKVFIDGRTEVYGGEFFKKYSDMLKDGGDVELFKETLEKHNITGAFLNTNFGSAPKEILKYLYNHKNWIAVYFDYDAVIFLKDTPENKSVVDRYSINFVDWKPKEIDLLRTGSMRLDPYIYLNRAYTLKLLELYDAAASEANKARVLAPLYGGPHSLLGEIYEEQEMYEKAFEHFRIAAIMSRQSRQVRYHLMNAYFDLGEYEKGHRYAKGIVSRWPEDPKALLLFSRFKAKLQQYDESLEMLGKACKMKLKAKDASYILAVGDVMYEQKEYLKAKEIYRNALEQDDESIDAYKKFGIACRATGDIDLAKKNFEKALSIDPDNEEIKEELKGLEEEN